MYKRRELLAKALMDTSKIVLTSLFVSFVIGSTTTSIRGIIISLSMVVIMGSMAWITQPEVKEKENQ